MPQQEEAFFTNEAGLLKKELNIKCRITNVIEKQKFKER